MRRRALLACTLLAACSVDRPAADDGELTLARQALTPGTRGRLVADGIRERFRGARHWFGQSAGLRFAAASDGLVPDWSTVTHPKVMRVDPAGQRFRPTFPARADRAMTVALDGYPGLWVRTVPLDARAAAAEVQDGLVVYPGAYGDSDLLYNPKPTQLDEYIVVPTARETHRARYRLELGPQVSRLALHTEALEVFDAQGVARMRISRPFARDSQGARRMGRLALEGDVLTEEVDLRGLAFPVLVDPDWTTTGRMTNERFQYSVFLLPSGEAFTGGGCRYAACPIGLALPSCTELMVSSERYDPMAGTWRLVASMNRPHYAYGAAQFPDGNVIVAGGCSGAYCQSTIDAVEIYDHSVDVWMMQKPISTPRAYLTGNTLPGGDALVAGGCDKMNTYRTTEIFDYAAKKWRAAASLNSPRCAHLSVTLLDGRVMVAGGCGDIECKTALDSVEIYDPGADKWTLAAPMSTARAGHGMILLPGGDVLVVGGCTDVNCRPTLSSAERWVAATGKWMKLPDLATPRHDPTLGVLRNGTYIVAGGCIDNGSCTRASEIFDPAQNKWTLGANISVDRGYNQSVVLADGRLLMVGGCNNITCLPWGDLYPEAQAVGPLLDGGTRDLTPRPDLLGDMPGAMEDLVEIDLFEKDLAPYPDFKPPLKLDGQPGPGVEAEACNCRVGTPRGPASLATLALVLLALAALRRRR